MNKHTVKDMYKHYQEKHPDSDVTYPMFSYVIEKFNKKVVENILSGRTFYLGHNLGAIRIQKVERNFNKPSINWGETNKLKAEGINQHVYYTDQYWYRWAWEKRKAKVKNKSVYKFEPTKGQNGARKLLVRTLKTDEFSHLNYKP